MMDFPKDILENTVALVKATGAMIREAAENPQDRKITAKARNSFVTDIDVASEKRLVDGLHRILPRAGFVTEEDTVDNSRDELVWIIDPIDGTTNFMHRIPCYAISVALVYKDLPLLGIVYEISHDECFWALRGEGAYLNGHPIHVSRCTQMQEAVIATGFPYHDHRKVDALLGILKALITGARGIRRLGSAAVDLAYVACGRFDGFYEHTLNRWDIAAGDLLVQEAGGTVSGFSGRQDHMSTGAIIAAPGALHQQLVDLVEHHFFAV